MVKSEATRITRTQVSQITYGSGNLQLSLAVRPRAGQPSLEVDGALIDRFSGRPMRVPAYLLRGNQILDEAETDEQGVFHMSAGLKDGVRLCLALGDDRLVELELGHRRSGRQESWEVRPTRRSA